MVNKTSRRLGEVFVGIVLVICGFWVIATTNDPSSHKTVFILALVVVVIGIAFFNLAYIRGFVADQQATAQEATRGGFLAPIAKGIEYLFGIRD